MSLNKYISSSDHPDLTEERRKATFDTDEMAYVIWENKQAALRRREITANVARLPVLQDKESPQFMDRAGKVDNSAKKITAMLELMDELDVSFTNGLEMFHLVNEVIGIEGHPLALHGVMFLPALQAQADDEQQGWWLQKALNREIIGTYAQTEMGHGTNLRKLETIATYDKKSEEFVLHSPTTTSMKWWPGNLGKSSNHAVVTAILMIEGKNYGPHNFFVQLRDEQTHMPMKGIIVGDIGPKFDYNATDNGFLRMDHVRIPRRHMLMRHSKVAADGTFTPPATAKAAYSAMVHVRSLMISHQGIFMAYALCAAIRYSAIRRQGEITPGAGEVRILDYQTQQHRLFPQLARSLAFLFTGYSTRTLYAKVSREMRDGASDDLADLHAITSGLKSVVTHQAGLGIEQARMSCGGHGYSKASGIPQVYGVAIGGCTYEGENMVMLLQLARYLMKAASVARSGRSVASLVDYLVKPAQKESLINKTADQTYLAHLAAFEHIARRQIFIAFDRLQSIISSGVDKHNAWNHNAVEMTRASRLHTRFYIAKCFYEHVQSVTDHAVREVLTNLLHLHLDYELIDMAHYLLQDNYLSSAQLSFLKEDMYRLLSVIRPNAVSIVDSWDLSDNELRSVLGRKDGHVYENLFKWAQESDLNRTQVLPSFEKYLKPMMDKGRERAKI